MVKDPGFGTKEVLFNAPDAKDDMIRVPRTI
jgi:Asp-tRNA(Asn)/Glu-tRNA(Gln) amidotransferase C subunit